MNRFRPNVVVAGTDAWAEDDWSRIADRRGRLPGRQDRAGGAS